MYNNITGVTLLDFSVSSDIISSLGVNNHVIYLCSTLFSDNNQVLDNGVLKSIPVIGAINLTWDTVSGRLLHTEFRSQFYPTTLQRSINTISNFEVYLLTDSLTLIPVINPATFKYNCVFKLITTEGVTHG